MKNKKIKMNDKRIFYILILAALVIGGILFYFVKSYAATRYTLTLMTYPSGAGYITKYPNWTNYPFGQSVQISAAPKTGYEFRYWSNCWGGIIRPVQSVNVQMTTNKICIANFRRK